MFAAFTDFLRDYAPEIQALSWLVASFGGVIAAFGAVIAGFAVVYQMIKQREARREEYRWKQASRPRSSPTKFGVTSVA
jgi:hypothetical protein